MYKERVQHSEETPIKIYYTDRQGVPVAIDILPVFHYYIPYMSLLNYAHKKYLRYHNFYILNLLLLSLGYLFICFGVKDAVPGVKVSMIWLTGLYFIHTMGEIALSPIGLSMVNKLSPLRFASLMMGIWYLSTATANKFAGMLSGLYPEDGKVKSLFGYQIATMYDFFMVFVVMSGVASLILFLQIGRASCRERV